MAGTAEFGGVVACLGDDHTGESSTVLHHSEFALVDVMMPILSPAGVQEVLDYGLLGWALSRYTGCWVGLKCVKDTIEVTEVVDGDPHRLKIATPADFAMPEGGLNIRRSDTPGRAGGAAARLQALRRRGLRPREPHRPPRLGDAQREDRHRLLAASPGSTPPTRSTCSASTPPRPSGSGSPPTRSAWSGRSTWRASASGRTTSSSSSWSRRSASSIEVQIKEAIFDDRRGRRVIGWKNEAGETIFSVKQALDPVKIARTLGTLLALDGVETETLTARRALLEDAVRADNAEEIAVRKPWFCSGCPHNTSTRLPEGARAYAGIGCHYMVQWMDRDTEGFTHMGGEGANWIGEAPFSTRRHVFQNLGDGTYNHSGVQAIRAALAAGVNITYKILFNDAVAMTGGQPNEGGLTAQQIARELLAMGVKHVVGVYDPKEEIDLEVLPARRAHAPARRARRRPARDAGGRRRLRHHLHPDLRRREAPPPQARRSSPTPTAASSSTPTSARAAATAACSRTASRSCRSRPSSAASATIDQSSCNKDFSCLERLLPELRHARGREGAQGRQGRAGAARPARARRCRRSAAPTTSSSPASAAPASSPSAR